MLSQKSILAASEGGLSLLEIGKVCLSVLPVHHSFECTHGIVMMIQNGTTICINNSLRYFADNLKLFQPDAVFLVPLFIERLEYMIWKDAREKNGEEELRTLIAKSNDEMKRGIDNRDEYFRDIKELFGGNLKLLLCGGAPLPARLMLSLIHIFNIIANIWNAPEGEAMGTSTVGSSEACMLGGMAMKFRWRDLAEKAGIDIKAKKPNLVISSGYQVCWEKFCVYWDIEMRLVPLDEQHMSMNMDTVMDYVDDYTIGIVGILGITSVSYTHLIGILRKDQAECCKLYGYPDADLRKMSARDACDHHAQVYDAYRAKAR